MVERRRHMRFGMLYNMTLSIWRDVGKTYIGSCITDVSRKGVGVISSAALNIGEKVELLLTLPRDSKPTLYAGHVAWVKSVDNVVKAGISFSDHNDNKEVNFIQDLLIPYQDVRSEFV